jgi:hypothetical protein
MRRMKEARRFETVGMGEVWPNGLGNDLVGPAISDEDIELLLRILARFATDHRDARPSVRELIELSKVIQLNAQATAHNVRTSVLTQETKTKLLFQGAIIGAGVLILILGLFALMMAAATHGIR